MARAFRYAEGDGPPPLELEEIRMIDRFGAMAVLGRIAGMREMRHMAAVENIVSAYRARGQAQNWAEWAQINPLLSHLLNAAAHAVESEEGNNDSR